MYDFDSVPARAPRDSVKWNGAGGGSLGDGLIPLWVADMDFPSPPAAIDAVRRRAEHPIYGYAPQTEDFFASFAGWLSRRQGVEVRREEMLFVPGVVPGIALAVSALTAPGDGILIQPPVYHPFKQIVERSGRRLVENPLRLVESGGTLRYEMDFEDLEAKLEGSRMLILCSPHNPVGRVWEASELARLAQAAWRKGVVLVSDEIHSDIVYAPPRHSSALSLPERLRERLVYFHAPSKTFNLAGLQAACAVVPEPGLRSRLEGEIARFGVGGPNAFAMGAAVAAYEEGGPWLDELLAYLRGNLGYLESRIASDLPSLSLVAPGGTYLAWIDFRRAGIRRRLHDFLVEEAGIWCDEGPKFGSGGAGFVRLNYGCPRALLGEALDRLAGALTAIGA